MLEFDIAIIGSGPAAVGALQTLNSSQRIGIVTGAAPSPVLASLLAPKIQAAAANCGEAPGIAEPLVNARDPRAPLFSTAAIGGLANYWGQQFVRCLASDPWPDNLFTDYAEYVAECDAIESLFRVEGGETLEPRVQMCCGFHARIPRLLTGTRDNPSTGLSTMRQVCRILETRLNATAFNTRAHSFARAGKGWRILLEDGNAIVARRVLLAAGVIGGARLLFRSYPDLENARFCDHSPWVLYVFGLGPLFAARPASALRHINAVTIEQIERDRCALFISIYDMRQADLNLLMALVIRRTSPWLQGWPALPGISLMKPVQIWTPGSEHVIEIDARTATATVVSRSDDHPNTDRGLTAAIQVLKKFDAHILKIGRTSPGRGFHYHGLRVKPEHKPFVPVAELLRERTNDGIVCIDASILPAISRRPHTLTAMASARRIVQRQAIT